MCFMCSQNLQKTKPKKVINREVGGGGEGVRNPIFAVDTNLQR